MAVVWWRGRRGAACRWGLLAVVGAGAAWNVVYSDLVREDEVARFAGDEPQLAEVTGVIDERPYVAQSRRWGFAQFSVVPPATVFVMRVESVVVAGHAELASGRLYVRIGQAEHRLRRGDRVTVTGWIKQIEGPSNPGEWDYRRYMASRGVRARSSVPRRENCRVVGEAWAAPLLRFMDSAGDEAAAALRLGMDREAQRLAFLDAILLGRRHPDLGGLGESFREVGLAHLLSISGAHLGILLGLVAVVARLFTVTPRGTSAVVLAVLGLFLLVVPPQVPIVRAGIMAVVFCLGYATGRQVRGVELLSLAALVALIWRPSDLFTPGFQLSFGGVAGLMLFVRPVSRWLWRGSSLDAGEERRTWLGVGGRWAADYVAVNVVGCLVAMPLVAYHFRMISPLALPVSVVVTPLVTAVLGLGYLKVLVGLLLPSVGMVMAGVVERVTDATTGLVSMAAGWRGASVELWHQPSLAWTVASLSLAAAVMSGWFAGRRVALVAAVGLGAIGMSGWSPWDRVGLWGVAERASPVVRVDMFAVGDGACVVVGLRGAGGSVGGGDQGRQVVMFDCGSASVPEVGERIVVPGLRELGVRWVDTLVISHSGVSHFNGSLTVMDRVGVGRVLVSSPMLREAQERPGSAAGYLLEELRRRGVEVGVVARGWREACGGAELEVHWPPPPPPEGLVGWHADGSGLVLAVRAGGRGVLLSGPLDRRGIDALLRSGADLRADVCVMPGRGSFGEALPRWLAAVRPRVLLHSCGAARLGDDAWVAVAGEAGVTRLATAREGMVELSIGAGGDIGWECFRSAGPSPAPPVGKGKGVE
jgi:competence protein ComEC